MVVIIYKIHDRKRERESGIYLHLSKEPYETYPKVSTSPNRCSFHLALHI